MTTTINNSDYSQTFPEYQKILESYKEKGLFFKKLCSRKQDSTILHISKNQLFELINEARKKLEKAPLGTSVIVEIKGSLGSRKKFFASLHKNSKNEMKLKIFKIRQDKLGEGGEGSIYKAIAIHSGKAAVYKEEKEDNFKGLDHEWLVHHECYSRIKDALNKPNCREFLKNISPKNNNKNKLFIPVVKPANVSIDIEILHKTSKLGMFLEKGTEGNLSTYINGTKQFIFEQRIQIAKDITAAVSLFESTGFAHLDLKPENVVIFKSEGFLRGKVIDMGFMEKFVEKSKVVNLNKGTATFIDRESENDSAKISSSKNKIDPKEINRVMIRRDRVALARLLLLLLMDSKEINEKISIKKPSTHSTAWEISFSSETSRLKSIYEALIQNDLKFDLKEVFEFLENCQQNKRII